MSTYSSYSVTLILSALTIPARLQTQMQRMQTAPMAAWPPRENSPICVFYLCVAFSILAAFLLEPSPAKRLLKQLSNTWLGVLLYALLVIAAADLIRLALKRLFFRDTILTSRVCIWSCI